MPVSSESFLEDFPTMFTLVLHSNPICDADPSCSLWIPVAPYGSSAVQW